MRSHLPGVLLAAAAVAAAQPPSPRAFLGHDIGEDRCLATYEDLQRYWQELARTSDRIRVETIGTTSYGQKMVMAVVSAPENLRDSERHRATSGRLARAKGVAADEAQRLADGGRAVVWIDGGLHATESVAGQNILELVWRLVSRDDAETRRIRENVITLVCPANPDGMEMVARAYRVTQKVGGLPVLYQRWMGHDNNRDFYMMNAPESRAINAQLYLRWLPQIVYNHHQSGPRGTVIFTPPFRDPFNYHVDPSVVRGIDLVAAHMNARFTAEGKAGVISETGAQYSTWWNGGLRTTAYFHNMIGILTEVIGSPNPSRIVQTLDRRLPSGDYPLPIESREWHARDTIEYLQTANFAILDFAARYRERLLLDAWRMGRRQIELGSKDHWTVTPELVALARSKQRPASRPSGAADAAAESQPDAQPESQPDPQQEANANAPASRRRSDPADEVFKDPGLRDARVYLIDPSRLGHRQHAANVLVQRLAWAGVEVERADRGFVVDGVTFAEGTWVLRCDQAFRPHLRDLLEPQWHPRDVDAKGDPVRPYDSTGWTLALQMGVDVVRLLEPLAERFPAVPAEGLELGTLQRRPFENEPRIGVLDTYGGSMEAGWLQFVLGQFDQKFTVVTGKDVEDGRLKERCDVLLVHAGLPRGQRGALEDRAPGDRATETAMRREEVEKVVKALPPWEDWSNAVDKLTRVTREKGGANLRAFVQEGGRLLAFGNQASTLVRMLDLPVKEGIWAAGSDGKPRRATNAEFYVPGSLLALDVASGDPLAHGMPGRVAVMFRNNPLLQLDETKPDAATWRVVARYAPSKLLVSGWAIGEHFLEGKPAVLAGRVGKGEVVLYGPDVIYRGQPWATFPLVLNALAR